MAKKKTGKKKLPENKTKKVLNGVDTKLEKDISKNKSKEKTKIENKNTSQKNSKKVQNVKEENLKTNDINEKIQSIVSILFTIVIFIALLFLIFVLYNNYLKPKEDKCEEKVDYHITDEMISNFIRNARSVIYNIEDFDLVNLNDKQINLFAIYFIWGNTEDYTLCTPDEENCLISKKEMPYQTLAKYFKNYLDKDNIKIKFTNSYSSDDKIRLYQEGENVVLTFDEFSYQSYKHDLIYKAIDEDKVTLVFALANYKDDTKTYEYKGIKTIELKYKNKNFIINKIKTSLTVN